MSKSGTWVLLLALVAAACGSSVSPDSGSAVESTEDSDLVEVVAVDRTVVRLIVVSSDPGSAAVIESVAALGLVDEIAVIGQVVCPSGPGVQCVADLSLLVEVSGRQVIVSLDGPASLGGLEALVPATNAIVVVGDPEDDDLVSFVALVEGTPVQVVRPDLEAVVAPEEVALLIGLRDQVAAYDSVEIATGAFVAVAHTVLDDRIEALRAPLELVDIESDEVPEPTIRWTFETPAPFGPVGLQHSAALADGVLAFLGNDGVARGLDAATGDELWATTIVPDGRIPPATFVAIAGDTVLMRVGTAQAFDGSSPHSVWALDLQTGEPRWSVENGGSAGVGHPATDGERVYVWFARDAQDQALRALEVDSGEEIWRLDGELGAGPLRVEDGVVWTGNLTGVLRGVDALTGEEVLRFETLGVGVGGLPSRPVVIDGLVMFGSDAGTFFAIDQTTGQEVWTFAPDAPELPSSPAILGDIVIFGSFDGNVYGLEIDSGTVRWRYPGVDLVVSSPVVADGVVYIGSFGKEPAIHAIDGATGKAVWRLPVEEGVFASPVVDDELVYIYTAAQVYAIER